MTKIFNYLICAAGFLTVGQATAETLTLYNDARNDSFVALAQPNNAGDMIIWHSDMQTEDGRKVGTGSGTCTRLDQRGNYFCNFVIDHNGHGILAGSGVQRTEPEPSVFPITGGTGHYQGVTGTMTSIPVENRKRFKYDIDYRRR